MTVRRIALLLLIVVSLAFCAVAQDMVATTPEKRIGLGVIQHLWIGSAGGLPVIAVHTSAPDAIRVYYSVNMAVLDAIELGDESVVGLYDQGWLVIGSAGYELHAWRSGDVQTWRLGDVQTGSLSSAPDGNWDVGLLLPSGEVLAAELSRFGYAASLVTATSALPQAATVLVGKCSWSLPAISPSGRLFGAGASGSPSGLWLFDTESPALSKQLDVGYAISKVAFATDATCVTLGSNELTAWSTETGERVWGPVSASQLLTAPGPAGENAILAQTSQEVWSLLDPDTGTTLFSFRSPFADVKAFAVSSDRSLLVSGGGDHQVWLWKTETPTTE
jgi:WD40 repeat protein